MRFVQAGPRSENDLRYVVKMEVFAAFDQSDNDADEDDRDHLEEIQDVLERLEDIECESIGEDVYQQLRFELVPGMPQEVPQKPAGRAGSRQGQVGGLQPELVASGRL